MSRLVFSGFARVLGRGMGGVGARRCAHRPPPVAPRRLRTSESKRQLPTNAAPVEAAGDALENDQNGECAGGGSGAPCGVGEGGVGRGAAGEGVSRADAAEGGSGRRQDEVGRVEALMARMGVLEGDLRKGGGGGGERGAVGAGVPVADGSDEEPPGMEPPGMEGVVAAGSDSDCRPPLARKPAGSEGGAQLDKGCEQAKCNYGGGARGAAGAGPPGDGTVTPAAAAVQDVQAPLQPAREAAALPAARAAVKVVPEHGRHIMRRDAGVSGKNGNADDGDTISELSTEAEAQPGYFGRWLGVTGTGPPPRPSLRSLLWTGAGCTLGIGSLAAVSELNLVSNSDAVMLVGSFGATASLLYGVPHAALAQPRNVFCGHVLSAFIGVSVSGFYHFEGFVDVPLYIAAPCTVAASVIGMMMTRTLHPPAAATALIAVCGSDELQKLGWWYPVTPVASSVTILIAIAVLFNNLSPERRYPHYWW